MSYNITSSYQRQLFFATEFWHKSIAMLPVKRERESEVARESEVERERGREREVIDILFVKVHPFNSQKLIWLLIALFLISDFPSVQYFQHISVWLHTVCF